AVILVPGATAVLAAIATHGRPIVVVSFTLTVLILVIVGIATTRRTGATRRPILQHTFYRITDRRVIRSDDRPRKGHQQAEIAAISRIVVTHGRRPAITIDGVEFADVFDPGP